MTPPNPKPAHQLIITRGLLSSSDSPGRFFITELDRNGRVLRKHDDIGRADVIKLIDSFAYSQDDEDERKRGQYGQLKR